MDNKRKLYKVGAITDFVGTAIYVAFIIVFFTTIMIIFSSMGDNADGVVEGVAMGFAGVIFIGLGLVGCIFLAVITIIYTIFAIINAVKMRKPDYKRNCVASVVLSAIMSATVTFFTVLVINDFIAIAFAAAACILVLIAQIVIAVKNKKQVA